jgi:hypothetical protein
VWRSIAVRISATGQARGASPRLRKRATSCGQRPGALLALTKDELSTGHETLMKKSS